MKIFGKTCNYWKESLGGLIGGVIMSILLFLLIDPHLSSWKNFIKEIPSMGMCAFGFLLTLLSVILQGNSSTIEWMKSRQKLFGRFIQYNKQIVILSLVITIYACLLEYFNFLWLIDKLHLLNHPIVFIVRRILISIFGGLITWFVINTFYFIRIFYLLIKGTK